LPSQTAMMVWRHLRKGIPLSGEIVYDLHDDIKEFRVKNIVGYVYSLIASKDMKRFCARANGVSYVTEYSIQKHYPSYSILHGQSELYFHSQYSSISLSNDAYLGNRDYSKIGKLILTMTSVAMNSERKGEKIFISIIKELRNKGCEVEGVIVGDGNLRKSFEDFAEQNGVADFIKFTGLLPSPKEVRDVLKNSDIFLFPTMGEGLPRGILEAMAAGLPVLSTPVGGIPEIIDSKYLFAPHDVNSFVNTILRLSNQREELNEMSRINYQRSRDFLNDILQKRRNDFYQKLRQLSDNTTKKVSNKEE